MKVTRWRQALLPMGLSMCVAVLLQSCGTAQIVKPDENVVLDARLSATDLRTVAQSMARDLRAQAQPNAAAPATIAFITMENRTGELEFDSYNLLDNIRQLLLNENSGAYCFADRELIWRIVAQRHWTALNAKHYQELGTLLGIDFFLTGAAYRHNENAADRHANYYRIACRLISAMTGEVVWEHDYQVKKCEHTADAG